MIRFLVVRVDRMIRFACALAVAAALATGTAAYAKPLEIGAAMPTFSGLEAADGKSYSSADFKDKDVLVVCITCNHCPMAVAYEDRMIAFAKEHAGPSSKIGFIAINVNNSDADKLDKMKERAKEKGFTFAYAYDPSQKIATELGATKTPEFYVFDKSRKLVYHGAFDDSPRNAANAKKNYVELAVKAAAVGEKPEIQNTAAVGCGIQFDR
jgi:thiol-disulfide isomerase/thioredoxin